MQYTPTEGTACALPSHGHSRSLKSLHPRSEKEAKRLITHSEGGKIKSFVTNSS